MHMEIENLMKVAFQICKEKVEFLADGFRVIGSPTGGGEYSSPHS